MGSARYVRYSALTKYELPIRGVMLAGNWIISAFCYGKQRRFQKCTVEGSFDWLALSRDKWSVC